MPKRFEPHRRLLQILVGSNLYGSPDASIRELIQNAWDAIQLRKDFGDGQGGTIEVRYSVNEGWFEVIDDGIGMDMTTVEESFLEIGQDKLAVLDKGSRNTQIGYFGIGVLSIFLIADKFEVATRHIGPENDGIRFEITGIDDAMNPLPYTEEAIGTRVKVFPRSNGSFSVSSISDSVTNYVRHVDRLKIISVDDGTTTSLPHHWATETLEHVQTIEHFSGLLAGKLGLNPSLQKQTGTLSNEITICNAGFLAEASVHDLLPIPALGIIGEVDLEPNMLTMGMSRERIQRDELWTQLGSRLQDYFVRFALDELQQGQLQQNERLDSDEVKRNLLLWYHYIPQTEPFSELYSVLERRLFETVPFKLADRGSSSLQTILSKNTVSEKLFF